MIDTELRTVTESPRPTGQDLIPVEPSHIHIPRPSRLRQSVIRARDQPVADAAQLGLEPGLETAA
jgi:hypothetical protein